MNLAKGFKRLTIVLSLLGGPVVFLICCITFGLPDDGHEGFFALLIFEAIGFFAVWIIYLVVLFVVKGFSAKNE